MDKTVIQDLADLKGLEEPVMITSCAGIGAKLKVALAMNRFEPIGSDCVAVCANDILCKGAEPLFFMSHIACSRRKTDVIKQIINGMRTGCELAGAEMTGGETAELSDLYGPEEIGIIGFMTGIADKKDLIDRTFIKPGNVIIGIGSSGLHTSGYSAVSNAFRNFNEGILNTYFDNIDGTLGDIMLEPSRIYAKAVKSIKNEGIRIRGIANITSGGIKAAVEQIIPEGLHAEISTSSFAHQNIFKMIEETGGFTQEFMYKKFNMGIGMAVIVASQDGERALRAVRYSGETAFVIGKICEGGSGVELSD